MKQRELHLTNANYDLSQFLARLEDLFLRDKGLFGVVTQQSALARTADEMQHVITKIDVLSPADDPVVPEIRDYGSLVFVRERLMTESLLARLHGLSEK